MPLQKQEPKDSWSMKDLKKIVSRTEQEDKLNKSEKLRGFHQKPHH